MNDDLQTRFILAREKVLAQDSRPSTTDLLKLYAHFKQATEGDCVGDRPGAVDFVSRAKYDAWKNLEGTTKAHAAQAYIAIVETLDE